MLPTGAIALARPRLFLEAIMPELPEVETTIRGLRGYLQTGASPAWSCAAKACAAPSRPIWCRS
jgi:hypothetical protein